MNPLSGSFLREGAEPAGSLEGSDRSGWHAVTLIGGPDITAGGKVHRDNEISGGLGGSPVRLEQVSHCVLVCSVGVERTHLIS